jgi:hypothetical protein
MTESKAYLRVTAQVFQAFSRRNVGAPLRK